MVKSLITPVFVPSSSGKTKFSCKRETTCHSQLDYCLSRSELLGILGANTRDIREHFIGSASQVLILNLLIYHYHYGREINNVSHTKSRSEFSIVSHPMVGVNPSLYCCRHDRSSSCVLNLKNRNLILLKKNQKKNILLIFRKNQKSNF